MTQRFPAEYINGMTIKAFSVKLMITCAFKHLLDCEWFNPRKPIWSEIPFWCTILSLLHSSSPQTFAGNVASFVWGSHPWLSVGLQVPPPQVELSSRAAFIWHFVSPTQLLACLSRCTRISLSSHVLFSLTVRQSQEFLFTIQPSLT